MSTKLIMTEDYCCGGGHCGELPGYTFTCPSCESHSFCRTGSPLNVGEDFKCLRCKKSMKVLTIQEENFEVELIA